MKITMTERKVLNAYLACEGKAVKLADIMQHLDGVKLTTYNFYKRQLMYAGYVDVRKSSEYGRNFYIIPPEVKDELLKGA